jgi:hypothetical protein
MFGAGVLEIVNEKEVGRADLWGSRSARDLWRLNSCREGRIRFDRIAVLKRLDVVE